MSRKWFPIARFFVSLTLLIGAVLHTLNLIFGTDWLLAHFFTPMFDSLFAIPMIIGGVATILARKEFNFRNRLEKIVVIWTVFYFLASVPLHVQTWITQDTEYIRFFPIWFSAVFLTYTTVMQYVWWNLKSKSASAQVQIATTES